MQPRILAPAAALAGAVLLAAACGGQIRSAAIASAPPVAPATMSPPAAPSQAPASAPPTAPAGSGGAGGQSQPARCHTAGLGLATIGPASGGAGNFTQQLGLTNQASAPCWLYGYPGMAMLDGSGHQLTTHVVRDPGSRFPWAHLGQFTLSPGATAPFWVHWEDVPVGTETTCPTSAGLLVTPPDETTQLQLATFQATACNQGQLDVSPVTPTGTTGP